MGAIVLNTWHERSRVVAVVVALTAAAWPDARAQTANGTAVRSRGPGVSLIVRPRVGDTLWLQMEQTIEMSSRPSGSGTRSGPTVDGPRTPPSRGASPEYGPRRTRATTRVTRLLLYAHSLVEASDLSVTTLLATTDSMAMGAGTQADARQPQLLPLPMDGRQVRVRVTADGAMRVNDPPPGAMELGATLASMPGMLPSDVVRVGDRWERDIVLPSLPVSGYRADGVVRARFRLDSLTHNSRHAWISMVGSLHREGTTRDMPPGTRVITAGTMRGTLVMDRHRAWIVDAQTVMDVQSEVSAGPGAGATPMWLDLRIQQRVRVK